MANSNDPKASYLGAFILTVVGLIFGIGAGGTILRDALKNGVGAANWVGLAGSAMFTLIGLLMIGGGIYLFRQARHTARLRRQYPDQPWLHDKRWASGRIKDSNLVGLLFITGFAVVWNSISWIATGTMIMQGEFTNEPAAYIVLLFPFIGLVLIVAAVYQVMRWRKYGTSVFELAEIPGVIGGSLGGLILTKVNIRPEDGFHLHLKNVHQWTSGSGKNSTTHTETLWESEQNVEKEAFADDPSRSAIPVFFNIPYSCKPTERLSSRSQNYWELVAKAKSPGLDYKASFRVPVFFTPDSRRDAPATTPASTSASSDNSTLPSIDQIPNLIRRPDFSGAEVLEFRALRHLLLLIIPALVSLFIGGGAIFAWRSGAPVFIPIVACAFVALTFFGFASSALTRIRILRYPDRLEIHKRTLFGRRQYAISYDKIQSAELKRGITVNNTQYYQIAIRTTEDNTVTIPCNIKGRQNAQAFLQYIQHP